MGFFDTSSNSWVCEDECTEKSDGLICGETNHLTSFALLLQGKGNSDRCESEDYFYAWLSLGFVGVALILFFIAVITAEIRMAYIKRKRASLFKRIATKTTQVL